MHKSSSTTNIVCSRGTRPLEAGPQHNDTITTDGNDYELFIWLVAASVRQVRLVVRLSCAVQVFPPLVSTRI